MIDIIKKKNTVEVDKTDIFIAGIDIYWNGIKIFENSLVTIDDNYAYINETPLNFFSLVENQYGEELKYYKNDKSFIIKNDSNLENSDETIIRNGEMVRWHNGSFRNRCIPFEKELIDLPTFEYKGVEYSGWGYMIDTDSKEIVSGFYKKHGTFFEKTGDRLVDDIELK